MKEDVFRYGENNRGFGMVTLPDNLDGAPLVVALNAGLLHRAEPYRLNVLLCRRLAAAGYICVRVDLSGKGDTPARERLTNRESVALDWSHIKQALDKRFGKRAILIMGLCSGADNAIKITTEEPAVVGLILLDPISLRDAGFSRREWTAKLTNWNKWINLPKSLLQRLRRRLGLERDIYAEMAGLRDEPTTADLQRCFAHIAANDGRVLAVFTSHALTHYNALGQFTRAMGIDGLERCCEEVFWPHTMHLYPVQVHRDQLLQRINGWAINHLEHLKKRPR